ncbi:hypothetical protein CEXT_377721 [Caerostris extrusa]|uniref:Uncharacterized protein n=1 Tax=Caerostris extrusa TaxID=172846 RepID=A0AAV4S6N0_CAEEX|nr:hypothetical protein CEXT_377721 [Caerostris extrusa]
MVRMAVCIGWKGGSMEVHPNSHRFLFLPKPWITRGGFEKGTFLCRGLFIEMITKLERATRKGWEKDRFGRFGVICEGVFKPLY